MSLFEQNLDDVQETRELPPGKYSGNIIGHKKDVTSKGTEKLSISFRPKETLTDADLKGVQLNKYVYMTLWLTEKAQSWNKTFLMKAGVETDGLSMKEIFENLDGQEVIFTVEEDKFAKDTYKTYKPQVTDFKVA